MSCKRSHQHNQLIEQRSCAQRKELLHLKTPALSFRHCLPNGSNLLLLLNARLVYVERFFLCLPFWQLLRALLSSPAFI
jgi:hypothetical protein